MSSTSTPSITERAKDAGRLLLALLSTEDDYTYGEPEPVSVNDVRTILYELCDSPNTGFILQTRSAGGLCNWQRPDGDKIEAAILGSEAEQTARYLARIQNHPLSQKPIGEMNEDELAEISAALRALKTIDYDVAADVIQTAQYEFYLMLIDEVLDGLNPTSEEHAGIQSFRASTDEIRQHYADQAEKEKERAKF